MRRFWKSWRLAVCLSWMCLGGLAYPASENSPVGFAVEGSLQCTFYRAGNGEVFEDQSLAFKLRVLGETWWMVNYESASNRWVRGSDGSGVYHVFHEANSTFAWDPGVVEVGPMPYGSYAAAVPWLAYASAGQLGCKEGLFAPWADPYSEPLANAYGFRVTYFEEPLRLPKTVEFVVEEDRVNAFRAGRYMRREGITPSDVSVAVQRIASEPVGFLGGRYEAIAVTNLSGLTIPTEFRLTKFRFQPPAPRSNYPIAAVYHGTVQDVRLLASCEVLPDISSKPIAVTDLRFRDSRLPIDSIRYQTTNSWITDTNDAFLLGVKQARVDNLPSVSKADRRRLLILGLILALLTVPLVKLFAPIIKRISGRKASHDENTDER